jgi:hypothetical protein
MHILSALWINQVGHKFDAALSKSAFGSRLRRYRPQPGSPEGAIGAYHLDAIGSFKPYFAPYRQWREHVLQAIRAELQADQPVIAITMDLSSYYHRIDPGFIANEAFFDYAKFELEPWEFEFTKAVSTALCAWAGKSVEVLKRLGCEPPKKVGNYVGGLPIGISLSRVLSNALLVGLDREIEEQLIPVYYGRYVDDIFIVLRDPKNLRNSSELFNFIVNRTGCFKDTTDGDIYLELPGGYQGETFLSLQRSKQKVFFLEGRGGLDLLDSIESQIRSVSSERRLMPNPSKLESMAAAKVLAAAGNASEEPDTLRRADGLSVRRLGWSVLLRAVETLARDLRHDDWRAEREKFYKFALNHIIRPDKIFDHLDCLPRLLSLAVTLSDWANAKRLFDATIQSLERVQRATASKPIRVNGLETAAGINFEDQWNEIKNSVKKSAADAILRSLRWGDNRGSRPLPQAARDLCQAVGLESSDEDLEELSCAIRESDWAKTAYKDHLRRDAFRQRPLVKDEQLLWTCYSRLNELSEFLRESAISRTLSTARISSKSDKTAEKVSDSSFLPYLFPTRPYSTEEVSLFLPEKCVFSIRGADKEAGARNWARYVRALRGVWVWESLIDLKVEVLTEIKTETEVETEVETEGNPPAERFKVAILDSGSRKGVLLGITSLLTSDDTWSGGASGRADLSRARYKRIEDVVNQAIKASPKPTHLLLPELSLPERWLDTVTGVLRESRISLIAGLDYHINESNIHSEAVLVLTDDRLGFPAYVRIHQSKTYPAPAEDFLLRRDFGKHWTADLSKDPKPVYIHKGFAFGVLVCSELQNIENRFHFQGKVDCLMVLSWNRDLETFSALVESASLDVHAYIALVNNRRFGDSRVRAPEKENRRRDLCRLRGGENEHVVVVRLDPTKLREFQSRAERWPEDADPFKPVPEGFRIDSHRQAIPR